MENANNGCSSNPTPDQIIFGLIDHDKKMMIDIFSKYLKDD